MPEIPDYLRSPTCWSLLFGSLVATGVLTPVVAAVARRVGAVDSGGHRRVYRGSMPLLGGLAILVPFLAVCVMGVIGPTGMFRQVASMRTEFLVLGAGSLAIVALGIIDDVRGLRARYKLLVQTAVALFVVLSGESLEVVRLPLVGVVHLGGAMALVVGVVWIVGLINAMNLIDGVDGLAAGVALVASLGLLVLGAIDQHTFVVLLCISLAGSLLGFLPYNFSPARIFLGDTGSLLLGFVLATITLMGTYKAETAVIVVAPLLALGFPIFETLLSMVRRLLRGAPIFAADDGHTHHRLLGRGYSQRKVVLLLYGVSGILSLLAIMSRVIARGSTWEWLYLAAALGTLAATVWLAGYMRSLPVGQVLERRQRNAVRHAFVRYAAQSLSSERSPQAVEEILGLGRLEFGLSHLAVTEESGARIVARGSRGGSEAEHMRVQSTRGTELLVEYEFGELPDRETRQDVVGCLAQLFELANLRPARRRPAAAEGPERPGRLVAS